MFQRKEVNLRLIVTALARLQVFDPLWDSGYQHT